MFCSAYRYDGIDTKAAICADDWSIEWSSLACHQLGYPRPMSDGVASAAVTQLPILRLNTSSVSNSLQAAVYPAGEGEACNKGAVAIGCHPAGKSNSATYHLLSYSDAESQLSDLNMKISTKVMIHHVSLLK